MSVKSNIQDLLSKTSAAVLKKEDLIFQRTIGSGAFAHIDLCQLKAEENALESNERQCCKDNWVAVKRFKDHVIDDPVLMMLVCNEAELLGKLNHSFIVKQLHVGHVPAEPEQHETIFLVEEYLRGPSLRQVVYKAMLSSGGVYYRRRDALRWLHQMADALTYLHSCTPKVMHRDIKLDNVLLTGADFHTAEARLVDFGLAVELPGAAIQELTMLNMQTPRCDDAGGGKDTVGLTKHHGNPPVGGSLIGDILHSVRKGVLGSNRTHAKPGSGNSNNDNNTTAGMHTGDRSNFPDRFSRGLKLISTSLKRREQPLPSSQNQEAQTLSGNLEQAATRKTATQHVIVSPFENNCTRSDACSTSQGTFEMEPSKDYDHEADLEVAHRDLPASNTTPGQNEGSTSLHIAGGSLDDGSQQGTFENTGGQKIETVHASRIVKCMSHSGAAEPALTSPASKFTIMSRSMSISGRQHGGGGAQNSREPVTARIARTFSDIGKLTKLAKSSSKRYMIGPLNSLTVDVAHRHDDNADACNHDGGVWVGQHAQHDDTVRSLARVNSALRRLAFVPVAEANSTVPQHKNVLLSTAQLPALIESDPNKDNTSTASHSMVSTPQRTSPTDLIRSHPALPDEDQSTSTQAEPQSSTSSSMQKKLEYSASMPAQCTAQQTAETRVAVALSDVLDTDRFSYIPHAKTMDRVAVRTSRPSIADMVSKIGSRSSRPDIGDVRSSKPDVSRYTGRSFKLTSKARKEETNMYNMTQGCGSLLYMAPCVFNGQPYNEKADVFSFAMCMYELLHVQLLLVGITRNTMPGEQSQQAVLDYAADVAAGYSGPVTVHDVHLNMFRPPINPSLPKPLETLLTQCWERDSQGRPSMKEVADRLQQFMASGGLQELDDLDIEMAGPCSCCM